MEIQKSNKTNNVLTPIHVAQGMEIVYSEGESGKASKVESQR